MAKARNAGIAGGVALVLLWGGLGIFFGRGKGPGKGKEPTDARSKVVKATKNRPITKREVRSKSVVKKATEVRPKAKAKETFRYVLRLQFIHPILDNGKISKETITLNELIIRGRQAKEEKKELHLKIQGDARAKWVKKLKSTLKQNQVAFSVSENF